MQARPLRIDGAWEFTPKAYGDDRGVFLEWFKADVFADAVGHSLTIAQANQSVSARGVIRGVHFAAIPPSQAKYVFCTTGAVLDVVIDIRVGSPTFAEWDAVTLDDVDHRSVYVAEGLGHAFMALRDDSAVTYLCSTPYDPANEFGIDPFDQDLRLPWPADIAPILSDKDRQAPTMARARADGLLPLFADAQEFYASLRRG